MAKFFPFNSGKVNTQPTVVNSSREKQRTMPALRNKASTAESELAIAPVWEDAARDVYKRQVTLFHRETY